MRGRWHLGHAAAVAAGIAVCGIAFIYTGDSDLFVVSSAAMALGLMAMVVAQIRSWFEGPR